MIALVDFNSHKTRNFKESVYHSNVRFKGYKNPVNMTSDTISEFSRTSNLDFLAKMYNQNRLVNVLKMEKEGIPNLRAVYDKGVRGETLSCLRNEKFLPIVKKCGVETIIELRSDDFSRTFKDKCKQNGLNYFYFPIDKTQIPDRIILNNLPKFIDTIRRGRFYIACAQGLHRTDIALAIHYAFDPKQKEPPFMAGHTHNHIVDMVDINRRLESIYKEVTNEDRIYLGWPENYDQEFRRKQQVLKTFSERL